MDQQVFDREVENDSRRKDHLQHTVHVVEEAQLQMQHDSQDRVQKPQHHIVKDPLQHVQQQMHDLRQKVRDQLYDIKQNLGEPLHLLESPQKQIYLDIQQQLKGSRQQGDDAECKVQEQDPEQKNHDQQMVMRDSQAVVEQKVQPANLAAASANVKVRWKPSEEQLRMLMKFFEEEGGTINKQRIKEIAVELSHQGDVTEANVHNWFHNRKARAKRKQKILSQKDGESEVDTDIDSRKRSKVDNTGEGCCTDVCASTVFKGDHLEQKQLYLSQFSRKEGLMRTPLRLPSDAVDVNSRMYETSLMLNSHQSDEAPVEKYMLSGFSQDATPDLNSHPQNGIDIWRPTVQMTYKSVPSSSDRSESKTITDHTSTESDNLGDSSSKAWSSSKERRKMGKGTMIRRWPERARKQSRKMRLKEMIRNLNRNHERDLKSLFVEIVKRIGTRTAKSLLSRLMSRRSWTSTSEDSASGDSQQRARSSRGNISSSPKQVHAAQYSDDAPSMSLLFASPRMPAWQQHRHQTAAGSQRAEESNEHAASRQALLAIRDRPDSSDEDVHSSDTSEEQETDVEKDDYRIVWPSAETSKAINHLSQSKHQNVEGSEKTSVTLVEGKPVGSLGTWWNSVLRHSSLLFLDISIPHIALQPEEGLVKVREYMDSKFDYLGGTIDEAYMKKQVAKALNFRRHKVMRMIEIGAAKPSDVSQDQWDALMKYFADPKRREKSDKQRAALKAMNTNGHGQELI